VGVQRVDVPVSGRHLASLAQARTPMRKSERVGRMLTGIVMLVLAVAAIMKLSAMDDFRESVESWSLLPTWLTGSVTYAVPGAELAIAVFWFLGAARPAATIAAFLLLAIFTSALIAHILFAEPPDCGCFGKHLQFAEGRRAAEALLGRNGVMMLCSLGGILLSPGSRDSRKRPAGPAGSGRLDRSGYRP